MNNRKFALILLLSFVTFTFVNGQTHTQKITSEKSISLRQILVSQPDYTAIEQTLFSEGFAGFGGESKVIKIGSRSVEIKADAIFIAEPGKQTIKVSPQEKTYTVMPVEKEDNFTFSPKILARNKDAVFKSMGTEKVGNYVCTKIEVTFKNKKNKTAKYKRLMNTKLLFWSAPELKNLIVRSDISLGQEVKFATLLKDITLTVDEQYFHIPKGYKKIIY